jgi:hypothetical protein
MAELMHDDYLEEYPQSGERIRGKHNARGVHENYPSMPNLIDFSYSISGDLAVVEMVVDYEGHRMNACQICDGPAPPEGARRPHHPPIGAQGDQNG